MQRKKWRGHDKNALCWSFYSVNDNNIVDGSKFKIMGCMIHHVIFIKKTLKKKKGDEL